MVSLREKDICPGANAYRDRQAAVSFSSESTFILGMKRCFQCIYKDFNLEFFWKWLQFRTLVYASNKCHFGYLLFWFERGPRAVTGESIWEKTVEVIQLWSSFQVTWLRINQGTAKSNSQCLGDRRALGQLARLWWAWPRSHEEDSISLFMGERQSQMQDTRSLWVCLQPSSPLKRQTCELEQSQENRRCSFQ